MRRTPFASVNKSAEIADVEDRSFTVIASDETVDRYGDIIRAEGWDLKNFSANPIALWQHRSSEPIGTVPKVWIDGTRLMAEIAIAPAGTDPFIDKVWNLIKAKVLRAVSVGFVPTTTPKRIEDKDGDITGFEYIGQELLELSVVSVPANPAALAVARSMRLDDESATRIFGAPLPPDPAVELAAASMALQATNLRVRRMLRTRNGLALL